MLSFGGARILICFVSYCLRMSQICRWSGKMVDLLDRTTGSKTSGGKIFARRQWEDMGGVGKMLLAPPRFFFLQAIKYVQRKPRKTAYGCIWFAVENSLQPSAAEENEIGTSLNKPCRPKGGAQIDARIFSITKLVQERMTLRVRTLKKRLAPRGGSKSTEVGSFLGWLTRSHQSGNLF